MLRIFRIKAIELHLVHKKQNFSSEVISGGGTYWFCTIRTPHENRFAAKFFS